MMMSSSRPYLIRAIYDWILDNSLTPYVLVDAMQPYVQVPEPYIEEGKIILNLAPLAVTGFAMNNEALEFKASFGGRLQHLYIPMTAILAIYAYENGRGLVFGLEDETISEVAEGAETEEDTTGEDKKTPPKRPKGPPKLTIVK